MFAIIVILVIVIIISIIWVNSLDSAEEYRKKNPTYKGHEFLNWDYENDEINKNEDYEYHTHTEDSF